MSSLRISVRHTTSYRSQSTVRSSHLRAKEVLSLSSHSQSARAPRVHLATLQTQYGRGIRSVLPRVSSYVAFFYLVRRYHTLCSTYTQMPAFASAVVLLLSLWGAKRSGTTLDPVKEMQDVRKCLMLLETAETRWSIAGRLRCVLVFH